MRPINVQLVLYLLNAFYCELNISMENTVNRIFGVEHTQNFVSGLYKRFLKRLREWLVSYLLYKHKNLILEFQNFHKIPLCFHATVAINRYIPRAWSLDSVARMLRYKFREKFCLKGLQDVFEKIISVPTFDLQMTSFTFTSEYTHIHTMTHTRTPSQLNIHTKTNFYRWKYMHTYKQNTYTQTQKYIFTREYAHKDTYNTYSKQNYFPWYTELLNRTEKWSTS